MANGLLEVVDKVQLAGRFISSGSERHANTGYNPGQASSYECNDNCDCYNGDCSDCVCTDCNSE